MNYKDYMRYYYRKPPHFKYREGDEVTRAQTEPLHMSAIQFCMYCGGRYEITKYKPINHVYRLFLQIWPRRIVEAWRSATSAYRV